MRYGGREVKYAFQDLDIKSCEYFVSTKYHLGAIMSKEFVLKELA